MHPPHGRLVDRERERVTMSKNDGTTAESAFDGQIEMLGKRAYMHTFKDTRHVKGLSKAGIALKQPADRLVCIDGITSFVEVKSTYNPRRFERKLIRKHQIGAAKRLTAAGGSYLYFVLNMNTMQWYRIPAEFILKDKTPSWTWDQLSQLEWNWTAL